MKTILPSVRSVLTVALVLVGCSDLDVLDASFGDELVEAQARTVELKVVDNADCVALSRIEHAQLESVANVVAVRRAGYPIDPESGILKGLPRNRPIVFDLSVLDAEGRQVARACEAVTLPDGATEIRLVVRTLPECSAPPEALDVAVVFDASLAMRNANVAFGAQLPSRVTAFFDEPVSPANDRFALIVHGPTVDPEIAVPLTEDRTAIGAGIEQAAAGFGGDSRLFDAARLGTIVLRARAVCGRRPVLLILAGGADAGPLGGRDLAIAGLAGDRAAPEDDLIADGIAVTAAAKSALDAILQNDGSTSQVALTAATLTVALNRTKTRLQGLVGP